MTVSVGFRFGFDVMVMDCYVRLCWFERLLCTVPISCSWCMINELLAVSVLLVCSGCFAG